MTDAPVTEVDEDTSDVVQAAGRFRIYLGAVAGVGKTYAMLNEGERRLRAWHRHRHRLRRVPRPCPHDGALPGIRDRPEVIVEYRGSTFEEMDLDAVLARKPAVALVDELAHTNVPGSGRHEKRWEDVLELIEAGISVITTVNIQHLESLADAVERISGIAVRERVPDWVVRSADQIELVDSSPEQLRRRMLHGNIYPADKVPAGAHSLLQDREPRRHSASWLCGSSPTRPTRRSSNTCGVTTSPTSGRRPSGSSSA